VHGLLYRFIGVLARRVLLTFPGFIDKSISEHRECLDRFSLLRASTETQRVASSISVEAFFEAIARREGKGMPREGEKAAMKQELIELLCRKSFKYSEEPTFKLVSGAMSRFYVNCKPTAMDPRGMYLIGHLVFDAIRDLPVAGIGGLTFGADPVAMSTAFVSGLENKPVKAFSIRKAMKDHGIARWIEGDLSAGEAVVVIDDVATTGGSTIQAVERARSEGLEVVRVVVLVDRQEGGMANIRQKVPDATAIVTRDELIRQWKRSHQSGI
jgi:orotate phosphoribosyltransferase